MAEKFEEVVVTSTSCRQLFDNYFTIMIPLIF